MSNTEKIEAKILQTEEEIADLEAQGAELEEEAGEVDSLLEALCSLKNTSLSAYGLDAAAPLRLAKKHNANAIKAIYMLIGKKHQRLDELSEKL